MANPSDTRMKLTGPEIKAISQHSKRHGFVPVVEWHSSRRGRPYRPTRGRVLPTQVEARKHGEEMARSYNAIASRIYLRRVNENGRVLEIIEVL